MSDIIDDVGPMAAWVADALTYSGYPADYSFRSLRIVDQFFEDNAPNGKPRPDGLLAEDTGRRIFALGCYVGEVLKRTLGGDWQKSNEDGLPELNLELHLPDGSIVWPIQRVVKRMQSSEFSIASYGLALGLDSDMRHPPV